MKPRKEIEAQFLDEVIHIVWAAQGYGVKEPHGDKFYEMIRRDTLISKLERLCETERIDE